MKNAALLAGAGIAVWVLSRGRAQATGERGSFGVQVVTSTQIHQWQAIWKTSEGALNSPMYGDYLSEYVLEVETHNFINVPLSGELSVKVWHADGASFVTDYGRKDLAPGEILTVSIF